MSEFRALAVSDPEVEEGLITDALAAMELAAQQQDELDGEDLGESDAEERVLA